jgi:predicted small metal-binding protein
MARKYVDCRDYPQTEKKCTLAISADTEEEVLEAAVQHAMAVHGQSSGTTFARR